MKKKKALKVSVIILAVLAVIALGGSAYMGYFVTDKVLYQNRGKDTSDNSIKQLGKWGYDLEAFNNTYSGEEVTVTAEDGNKVPGTYFNNNSDKLVILVHGAGGDRVCIYPLAECYLKEGYDVIAYDQRGCGKNPDERVSFGILESLDVKAWVKYAREELGKKEVIVHGQSMGGQTTAVYASNVIPGEADAADAVICDSPVPGMEYMIRYSIGDDDEGAYSAVTDYLVGTSKLYMRLVDGISYDDGDTTAVVAKDQLPTLVIVSERDKTCLPEKVEEVYENVGAEKKEIVYVDSAHIEGVIDDPEGYMENVDAFLESMGL